MKEYEIALKVLATLLIAFCSNQLLRWLLKLYINKYAKKISADPTSFSFLKNSAGFIIYSAAIIYIIHLIPGTKNMGAALFAGAGIFAAIIGFAAQKAMSNIIGGVFILIFRPFRVGDIISIGTSYIGIVEEITLRHIIIRNYENRRIVIPNSIISDETIVNSSISDLKIKKHIEFRVDYNADIDKALSIIKEEAENHPLTIDNRDDEQQKTDISPVVVRVIALEEYYQLVRAYVWAANADDAFVINCDLNYLVRKRFKENGIDIAFPYRNIVIKKES